MIDGSSWRGTVLCCGRAGTVPHHLTFRCAPGEKEANLTYLWYLTITTKRWEMAFPRPAPSLTPPSIGTYLPGHFRIASSSPTSFGMLGGVQVQSSGAESQKVPYQSAPPSKVPFRWILSRGKFDLRQVPSCTLLGSHTRFSPSE